MPGPAAVAFGVLSDTNRWDRLAGVTASTYTFELGDPTDPTSRTRIGRARFMGLPMEFAEEGEYWAGLMLRGERRFRGFMGRLLASASLDVTVDPIEDRDGGQACRANMRCSLTPSGFFGYVIAPFVLLQLWITMRRYMGSVRKQLARGLSAVPCDQPFRACEPPAVQAKRTLLAAGRGSKLATGPTSPTSKAALKARTAAFGAADIDATIKRRLLEFLLVQPDEALLQVRPFEVANAWGAPRREVLRAFLYAARAGLFDLEWQVNCPTCRVGADVVRGLEAVKNRLHCDECDISYDVDFGDNVEATFTPNPAIRRVPRMVFCASSAYFQPHVHGYVTVPPKSKREVGPLPDGAVLLRSRGTPRQLFVGASERAGGPVVVRVTNGAVIRVDAPFHGHSDAEPSQLFISNETDMPLRMVVERGGWNAEIVRGSLLVTLPEFIELFGTEAPATGMKMAVGRKAIVFTDIVGSTELYDKLGDARAFALVQEHWRSVDDIVVTNNGTLIKTMGDGVMCVFPSIGDAITASFAMIDHTDRVSARDDIDFSIRVGVHEGACYAVRANDRLDLFGSTVNLAARLMGCADGRQVAMLASSLEHPALHARLEHEEAECDTVRTSIRGLRGTHDVLLASRNDAEVFSTGEHPRVAVLQQIDAAG
jgi:class 3 adenylate cyclase